MPIQIATRLGETLLDVVHVERDYTLGETPIVHDGVLVVPPSGRIGLVQYCAREIPRPARELPYTRDTDRSWLPYVAAALVVHVGIWGIASVMHPPVERAPKPVAERPLKIARIAAEPALTYAPPDDRARDRVDDTKAPGAAAGAAGEASRAGGKAPKERGHIAIKNTGEGEQLTKAEAIERARQAGVMGSAQTILDNLPTLSGADRLTSGFDQMNVVGSTGDAGASSGSFGFGASGFNTTGGGGTGWGTIGSGRYGTIGAGTTAGHAWGGARAPQTSTRSWRTWDGHYEYSPMPMWRLARSSRVSICPQGATPCSVEGQLDKAIVRRYVRRNIAKLEYCYEKEVLSRPAINKGGIVTLSFTIDAEGSIEVDRAQGFDSTVAICAAGVLMGIDMPPGGAVVEYTLSYRGG